LSISSCAALADSEVGSWNPLEDRLLATGTPKIPAATITNTATAMTRRGAAIASNAIRCSTSRPSCTRGRKISGNLFTVVNNYYEIRPGLVHRPPSVLGSAAVPVNQISSVPVDFEPILELRWCGCIL
jgi:hypothetical protein